MDNACRGEMILLYSSSAIYLSLAQMSYTVCVMAFCARASPLCLYIPHVFIYHLAYLSLSQYEGRAGYPECCCSTGVGAPPSPAPLSSVQMYPLSLQLDPLLLGLLPGVPTVRFARLLLLLLLLVVVRPGLLLRLLRLRLLRLLPRLLLPLLLLLLLLLLPLLLLLSPSPPPPPTTLLRGEEPTPVMSSSSSSLSSVCLTNTSCTWLPLRAIILCPPGISLVTRSWSWWLRPLARKSRAGTMVPSPSCAESLFRIGMSPLMNVE